jgi:homoserine kinase type II
MAVYTKLTIADVNNILMDYDIGDVESHSAIAEGIENTNYLLKTSNGKFILTIFEQRVKKDDLPFYINLIEYLYQQNLPCPKIIRQNNGESIFQFKSKSGLIQSFLDGEQVSNITIQHCHSLGKFLGEMHLGADGFTEERENSLSIDGQTQLYQKVSGDLESNTSDMIAKILTKLKVVPCGDLPKGVIHGDLFPDNLFWQNDKISGVIDFYFACHYFLIYDIAVCINAWCFDEQHVFDKEKYQALLDGYEQIRQLSDSEKSMMKPMCLRASMRFFLTRTYDQIHSPKDALVNHKDPDEYLIKLKFFDNWQK